MLIFATATDHTGRAGSGPDWGLLAHAEATLVFYMGVRALETITASLTVLGRDPREPAVLVERVGSADERIIASRLGEVADAAHVAGAESPAVLITGPTVASASAPLSVRRIAADAAFRARPVPIEA
jgi:siroheme synthase